MASLETPCKSSLKSHGGRLRQGAPLTGGLVLTPQDRANEKRRTCLNERGTRRNLRPDIDLLSDNVKEIEEIPLAPAIEKG